MKRILSNKLMLMLLPAAGWLAGCASEGGKGSMAPEVGVGGGSMASYVLNTPPIAIELRPNWHVERPLVTTGPTGYSPAQIRHAYGVDQFPNQGAGQVIAIVDAYGSSTIQSDLNTFSAAYGLPPAKIEFSYPGGKPTTVNASWELETTLDVEWAHAIAPEATLLLVVAKSAGIMDLLNALNAAGRSGAHQVSMSWGSPEFNGENYFDTYFERPGVTFVASAGDSGAGVDWPASSPYVLSVGGTTMHLDSLGNILSDEIAWAGSGGGVSAYQPRPAFQDGWHDAEGRGVPDVSYNSDPKTGYSVFIGDYKNAKGWLKVGGTSAGAPQWAALLALVNANRLLPGVSLHAPIYSAAAANYTFYYLDIRLGNNDGFDAARGYDFVTGLGPPVANHLLPALSSFQPNVPTLK